MRTPAVWAGGVELSMGAKDMKQCGIILAVGFVFFMGSAMIQEWEVFSSYLKKDSDGSSTTITAGREQLEQEITTTIKRFLTIMCHVYTSNGDARFLERLPSSPEVSRELSLDVDYLARNHRRLQPKLMQCTPVHFSWVSPERVEVTTKEYWIFQTFVKDQPEMAEPIRSQVCQAVYRMEKSPDSWLVREWDPQDLPAGETPTEPPPDSAAQ